MTREEIIALAREAGIIPTFSGHPDYPETDAEGKPKFWAGVNQITLERFAALVAAAEREECAKLVESSVCDLYDEGTMERRAWNQGTVYCATAIRERGSHV